VIEEHTLSVFLNPSKRTHPTPPHTKTNTTSPGINDQLPVGAEATVMGFGATAEGGSSSDLLMMTNVTIDSMRSCNTSYGGILKRGQMCAGVFGFWVFLGGAQVGCLSRSLASRHRSPFIHPPVAHPLARSATGGA